MASPSALILLAAVLAACATALVDDCPAAFIQPCECVKQGVLQMVQCSHFSNLESLQAVFDNSVERPFAGFILRESSITFLNASWPTAKQIRHIIVRNTSLISLFDRTPPQSDAVTHLLLHDVRLMRGVQWEQFRPFESLREVVMEGVAVRKLGNSFRENTARVLRKLSLKGSRTNQLDDHAFQKFSDLETFEIRNAEVKTMKRSMFSSTTWLVRFDLSNNHIESLPDDMFDKMPRIRYIVLNGNKLKTLPGRVFQKPYYETLLEFHVEENPVICDCGIAWMIFKPGDIMRLEGHCLTPPQFEGRELSTLTKDEFNYCPRSQRLY